MFTINRVDVVEPKHRKITGERKSVSTNRGNVHPSSHYVRTNKIRNIN